MPSSLKFSSEDENRYWSLVDLVAKSGPGALLLEGDMKTCLSVAPVPGQTSCMAVISTVG